MKHKIGTFEVKSGTLMVSDPCYGPDTWCQGRLDNVARGTWQATVEQRDVSGWGTRNAVLTIQKVGANVTEDAQWQNATFHVGVDSGQAGFWDLPEYGWGEGECGDTSTFYGKACSGTLDTRLQASAMNGGVVSSSGFGDGGYTCSYLTDGSGEIVAARIVFIGEEEDAEAAE